MSGIEILLSDNRGVYIPRDFADFGGNWDSVTAEDIEILQAGPDTEGYWDAWDAVTRDASYTDEKGNVWRLYQDGDLFAYCEELMDDEEYEDFYGEARSDLDTDSLSESDNWYDTSAELA
jgi:hypothetical protein